MLLINFQLWARNREIPGVGSVYISGGVNIRGKRLKLGWLSKLWSLFESLL